MTQIKAARRPNKDPGEISTLEFTNGCFKLGFAPRFVWISTSSEAFVGSCQGEHGATLMRCSYIFSEATASSFQVKLKAQDEKSSIHPGSLVFSHVDFHANLQAMHPDEAFQLRSFLIFQTSQIFEGITCWLTYHHRPRRKIWTLHLPLEISCTSAG